MTKPESGARDLLGVMERPWPPVPAPEGRISEPCCRRGDAARLEQAWRLGVRLLGAAAAEGRGGVEAGAGAGSPLGALPLAVLRALRPGDRALWECCVAVAVDGAAVEAA